MTVLTGVSSNEVLNNVHFFTWFLKEVTELLTWILNLDHITGSIYLILCFPYVVVLILGIIKFYHGIKLLCKKVFFKHFILNNYTK